MYGELVRILHFLLRPSRWEHEPAAGTLTALPSCTGHARIVQRTPTDCQWAVQVPSPAYFVAALACAALMTTLFLRWRRQP